MAAFTSSRCLMGTQAFTGLRPRQASLARDGTKCFYMPRKQSFCVEVYVGEDEPEDIAVRKFMKKVYDSRIIDQVRAKRYFEKPLVRFERRTKERIKKIKDEFKEPTWEEEYGLDAEARPFQEFFPSGDAFTNSELFLNYNYSDDYLTQGGYLDSSYGYGNNPWGAYGGQADRGGFIGGGFNDTMGGVQDDFYPSRPQTYMGDQGGYMADPKAAGQAPAAQ